jgi:hypothetical protein
VSTEGDIPGPDQTAWEPLPDNVSVAAGIDLTLDDPAWTGEKGKPRQCVAEKAAGGRCGAIAVHTRLLCSMHAGLADPQAAARTRAERRRLTLVNAENRVAERSLGVRAALGAALAARETDLRRIINGLIDGAVAGDQKAASLLLPYLDQALGRPTERIEHHAPTTPEELESLSTSELEALVAQGRAAQAHRQ